MIGYEIFRGLAFRRIKHPLMKWYNTWLPMFFAVLTLAVYRFAPVPPPLLGKDGVFITSLAIFATLPGFYFAGLAAVATFGSPYMDNLMPAPTPSVEVRASGRTTSLELSRRQFLSYLFSYLV